MDLNLIEHDQAAAQVAYRQYRQLRTKSAEDDQIMRAYRQAAKGTPVLNITEAIIGGGLDSQNRPRLAVVRADIQWAIVEFRDNLIVFDEWKRFRSGRPSRAKQVHIRWPGTNWRTKSARAMVPIIPAHLRPVHALHNYHVLWEAEWTPAPPRDPALLKHIGGDLYAVLAVWDLTEIERAVLAGRRPE